jgi:adenylate kinase family enzyme
MTGFQIVSEALLYTSKDLTLNLAEFENGTVNTLFITGYTGSGKSYTGDKLSKKYKATKIELDRYIEEEADKLVKKHGGIKKAKTKPIYAMVFKALEDRVRSGKERLVLEGIDVMAMNRKLVLSNAVIILGTSVTKSTWQAWARNIKYKKYIDWFREKTNIGIMWATVKSQVRFEKMVREFSKDVKAAQ